MLKEIEAFGYGWAALIAVVVIAIIYFGVRMITKKNTGDDKF